jgi:fatty-acyl-CoA synthase
VVVSEKTASVTGEELIRFCRERLAAYKSPKSISFRNDLPGNAMGEIQKAKIRAEVC